MTAAASSTPLSVDYTGRDYYAIRDQLIQRVKERVPEWQGSDPNDFGLALIEAFSYMGDLINYYVDRVANESFILTATQRESLLNIASMYGYKPANYVSSSTTLSITNSKQGYQGAIGGAIIESGDATHTLGNYAKVIVPNDHPFTVSGPNNFIKVNSMPNVAVGTVGDVTLTYNTSVFNGVFPVSFVGYDNFGKNVVWYRPSANVTNVAPVAVTVTAAVGSGTVVTYTASNAFAVGDVVTITGLGTESGSSLNLSNVVIASVTSTQFTVNNTTTGVSSGTGTATASSRFVITVSDTNRTLEAYNGQKILLHGVVSSGNNYNGKWVVDSSIDSTLTTPTQIVVTTTAADTVADISNARVSGSNILYSAWNDFIVGEYISVTKASPNNFNVSNKAVTVSKNVEVAISKTTYTSSPNTITYYVSDQLAVGDYVSIRNISSTDNVLAQKDLGYNLTDQTVADTSATTSIGITSVVGASPITGQITYQTVSNHSFVVGDYVTMTGIANSVNTAVTQTDVYNLKSAKIINVPSPTTFVVEGYWTNAFDAVNSSSPTATMYAFTLTGLATAPGNMLSTGIAVSQYFGVAKGSVSASWFSSASVTAATGNGTTVTYTATNSFVPGQSVSITGLGTASGASLNLTNVIVATASGSQFTVTNSTVGTASGTGTATLSSAALATPQVGGTYSSGGEVVYAEIPTLIVSGPYVTSVGSTVVPKGTQVSTQVTVDGGTKTIVFSTQSDIAVPYRDTASVLAIQGEDISLRAANAANTTAKPYDIAGELLGYSDGTADQVFALKEVTVDPHNVRVFIDNGTAWEEWTRVDFIQDYTPSSAVFSVSVAASEEVSVVFGDGISGMIPPKESGVKAVYISGGGVIGNVSADSLTTWDSVLGVNAPAIRTMSVTNAVAATGGADPESNDSIRYNAPRSLRSLNRAVTLEDFANLALSIDGVVKSNAIADSRSSVTVYIAPNATGSAEETPGVDSSNADTPQMTNYISLVSQYLANKKQIGTTVTVLSPAYSPVHVDIQYSALPQYNPSTVSTAIKQALLSDFSYSNVDFADVITPEEVEFKLRQVEGVSNVKVTGLFRVGGSGRNSLIGDPSEIFVFTEAETVITPTSPLALANTITFVPEDSAGSSTGSAIVSPTFNQGVYAYALSLPTGTKQVAITLGVSANASITVNDNAVSGGTITVPVASYETLAVTVVAQDGITTNTYRFKVTISS
jgi:hypothetical protein